MDMQHQVMGYDRAATLFSPEGRLLQVEYAEKTVKLGSSIIGLICTDGVVLIADKRIKDSLVIPDSIVKIYEIDSHILGSAAGILSDARVLMEKAQLIAQQNRITYDGEIDVESIMKEIANLKQAYSQYGGVRPFGVKTMIAGVNQDSSKKLFVSDITGNYVSYKANAIGEYDDKLIELLKEEYKENLDTEQAIKLGLNLFKKILGKSFNILHFEVCYVKVDSKRLKRLFGNELLKYAK